MHREFTETAHDNVLLRKDRRTRRSIGRHRYRSRTLRALRTLRLPRCKAQRHRVRCRAVRPPRPRTLHGQARLLQRPRTDREGYRPVRRGGKGFPPTGLIHDRALDGRIRRCKLRHLRIGKLAGYAQALGRATTRALRTSISLDNDTYLPNELGTSARPRRGQGLPEDKFVAKKMSVGLMRAVRQYGCIKNMR